MRTATTPLLMIALLFLSTGLSLRPFAQGGSARSSTPIIRVVPSDITDPHLSPSENFTITVEILNVTDLVGLDIQLSWNPSILNYTSHLVKIPVETYPDGILHAQVMGVQDDVNITLGTYWIAYATINGPSFNGSGTVFEMTFTVLSYGSCALDIFSSDLADPLARPIDHLVEDGHFSNLFYDVAITSVTASTYTAAIGHTISITVIALNNGSARSETFDVTAYHNDTVIATQSVTSLPPGAEATLVLQWDTTGESPGGHVLSANATTVLGENATGNNRYVDGLVTLALEPVHDVALVSLTPSKTLVFPGHCFHVNLTIENQGNVPESVNVTIYGANVALINTAVPIEGGTSLVLKFSLSTVNAVEYEYFLLNATAEPLPDEIDVTDNTVSVASVRAVHLGDFDADGDVDIFDVVRIASAYASEAGDPTYDVNLDVDCDGQIGIFDVVTMAASYGFGKK